MFLGCSDCILKHQTQTHGRHDRLPCLSADMHAVKRLHGRRLLSRSSHTLGWAASFNAVLISLLSGRVPCGRQQMCSAGCCVAWCVDGGMPLCRSVPAAYYVTREVLAPRPALLTDLCKGHSSTAQLAVQMVCQAITWHAVAWGCCCSRKMYEMPAHTSTALNHAQVSRFRCR